MTPARIADLRDEARTFDRPAPEVWECDGARCHALLLEGEGHEIDGDGRWYCDDCAIDILADRAPDSEEAARALAELKGE